MKAYNNTYETTQLAIQTVGERIFRYTDFVAAATVYILEHNNIINNYYYIIMSILTKVHRYTKIIMLLIQDMLT